jgi:hypothetical protein
MKITKELKGKNTFQKILAMKAAEAKETGEMFVVVSYTAEYALAIHENTEMTLKGLPRPSGKGDYWDAAKGQGASKYLETPARELAPELGRIVAVETKSVKGIRKGLFIAGQRLQRESQKLVPFEYGHLRASAQTTIIDGK